MTALCCLRKKRKEKKRAWFDDIVHCAAFSRPFCCALLSLINSNILFPVDPARAFQGHPDELQQPRSRMSSESDSSSTQPQAGGGSHQLAPPQLPQEPTWPPANPKLGIPPGVPRERKEVTVKPVPFQRGRVTKEQVRSSFFFLLFPYSCFKSVALTVVSDPYWRERERTWTRTQKL